MLWQEGCSGHLRLVNPHDWCSVSSVSCAARPLMGDNICSVLSAAVTTLDQTAAPWHHCACPLASAWIMTALCLCHCIMYSSWRHTTGGPILVCFQQHLTLIHVKLYAMSVQSRCKAFGPAAGLAFLAEKAGGAQGALCCVSEGPRSLASSL